MFFKIIVFIILSHVAAGEYHIKRGISSSYLYQRFADVKEDVFPSNIRMRLTLSTFSGTLLYSMDRHNNQLILSLYDNMGPNLQVEFNKKKSVRTLHQICGCQKCLYKSLDLGIQINGSLTIQCNNETIWSIEYNKTKELNEGYPIPSFENHINKTTSNEGHLWVGRFISTDNTNQKTDNLAGCIMDVSYNDRQITFTNISDNIRSNCSNMCNDNICKGGECSETSDREPMCNCSRTFNNGRFCNVAPLQINGKFKGGNLTFQMFKLSWQSSSDELLLLSNKDIRLRLFCSGKILKFNLEGGGSNTTSILSRSNMSSNQNILIVTFQTSTIEIEIFDNTTTHHKKTLWSPRDIRSEVFTGMMLRSNDGTIGIVSKTSVNDFSWKEIATSAPVPLIIVKKIDECAVKLEIDSSKYHTDIGIIIAITILVALIAAFNSISLFIQFRKSSFTLITPYDKSKYLISTMFKIHPLVSRFYSQHPELNLKKEVKTPRSLRKEEFKQGLPEAEELLNTTGELVNTTDENVNTTDEEVNTTDEEVKKIDELMNKMIKQIFSNTGK